MKIAMLAAALVAFVSVLAPAVCRKNYEDCPHGACACYMPAAAGADPAAQAAWVSAEKPPADKMPSYQREGIRIVSAPAGVEPSTTTAHDYRAEGSQQ